MSLMLTESQQAAIYNAAMALHPADRDQFYLALAAELLSHPMLGDGVVTRCIRAVQPRFFHPEPAPRTVSRWAR
jgi:hypothetical protein